jgi:hypothetical protein
MLREELVEILGRIPELDHPKIQFVMQNGSMMSLDILVRMEPTYMVMRGREAGNQDEGRAFFVPYADISFLKIERVMTLSELDAMFSDLPNYGKRTTRETRVETEIETPLPQSSAPLDPAAIAKQNLLDRIRAAKSISASPRPTSK